MNGKMATQSSSLWHCHWRHCEKTKNMTWMKPSIRSRVYSTSTHSNWAANKREKKKKETQIQKYLNKQMIHKYIVNCLGSERFHDVFFSFPIFLRNYALAKWKIIDGKKPDETSVNVYERSRAHSVTLVRHEARGTKSAITFKVALFYWWRWCFAFTFNVKLPLLPFATLKRSLNAFGRK